MISAPIAQWIECQPAELKIQVRFLLGARLKIYPFSVESGFFSYTSSSVSAKAKKCIFLVDPVWCTVNAKILLFLVDKSVNIPAFSANYNRTTQIAKIFLHTIIITSRRESIKTTKIFCENYEYTGHSLDTITLRFSLLSCKILAAFIMSKLHKCGHYKLKK